MADVKKTDAEHVEATSENRDPLSGEKGAHPVGTGVGAAVTGAAAGVAGGALGVAMTGAAVGAAGGPIGAVVGAVVGAVAGGLAGKGIAEGVNPTAEHEHWRANYQTRPYVESGHPYETYEPAYQYGIDARTQHADKSFDEAETDLARGWDKAKGESKLGWEKAKHASRDAWDRLGETMTRKG